MDIILVRHGQTQWNQVERFRGQVDVALNETGLAQAEATARRIASQWKPQAVFSSPLSRAMVTAQTIAAPFSLTAHALPGLMDVNFGAWQGLSLEQARENWPDQINNYIHRTDQVVIPGGGSLAETQATALIAIEKIVDDFPGGTVVLVSHTVVNRLVLLGVLGLGLDHFWAIQQDNCAISAIRAEKGHFVLVSMNDTCHLHSL